MRWFVLSLTFVVLVAWGASVAFPEEMGTCREVAVSIGKEPTVRECHAYSLIDIAPPLAILGFVMLLFTEDFELGLPGGATLRRRKKQQAEGKQAGALLSEKEGTLDARAAQFLETLPGSTGPGRIAREGRNAFASSTPRPAEVPAMVQEEMTQETGFRGPNSGKDHQTKTHFRGMGVLRPLADVLAWAYGCLD